MGVEDQSTKSFMVNKVSASGGVDNSWRSMEVVLRVLVAVIAATAAIVMGKDKQQNVFQVASVKITVSAQYTDVRAFVFFVYANAIVAIYSILIMPSRFLVVKKRWILGLIFVMDQVMAYLLMASAAASTEVAYVAKQGESKLMWSEVCSNYERFCLLVGISIVFSFIAVLTMAMLVTLSGRRFFLHTASSKS